MQKFTKIILVLSLFCGTIFGKTYKGAEYRTHDAFTYGRFEVSYKSSIGPGHTSTFFTYHELGGEGTAAWNEIDIEILGRYDNDVQFNPITPGQQSHVYHQQVDFDPADDFHVYAFEWTPEYVAWFIDGVEMHRQTGAHIEALNREQKIMMNIWPPAYQNWVGTLDPATLPKFAYYDYVSYAAHTPGSGDIGTDNNFTLEWKDDFDSWDKNRWGKATHTFVGNNCDFIHDNAVFRDGNLVLCLTDGTNTGYTDKNPPVPQGAWYDGHQIQIEFSEPVLKASAENSANYILRNGGEITAIALQKNQRDVILSVKDYDMRVAHDIMVANIEDSAATPNTSAPKFLNIVNPPQYDYPLKINVGGDATGDFLADQKWDFEKNYGYMPGAEGSTTQPIANTTLDAVYRTEIRDFVMYKVRVPKGIYTVKLMFSENYFTENGKRVFDINIEGDYVVKGLDVFKEAGSIHTAYDLLVENIEVEDCVIDIHFASTQDFSFLHGLEIVQVAETALGDEAVLPVNFYLEQNYPNPFNPETTIPYTIKKKGAIELSVFDVKGKKIDTIISEDQNSGHYNVKWNGSQYSSGIYFYKLSVDAQLTDTQKMVLIK